MTDTARDVVPLDAPSSPSAAAPAPAAPEFVTIDEAAEILRLERKAVYRLAGRGELPGCQRLGRTFRVHLPSMLSWFTSGPRADRKRGRTQ